MATRDPVATQLARPRAQPDIEPRPRVTVLGSPGLAYLRALMCASLIKQGFDVDLFTGSYERYDEWLSDPGSDLCLFHPHIVLVAVSAQKPIHGGHLAWTKQELGAGMLQRTVMPILSSVAVSEPVQSGTPLSILKKRETELRARSVRNNIELCLPGKNGRAEMLLTCQAPPMWRRTKSPNIRGSFVRHPLSRAMVALFGAAFSWLIVDIATHPWMAGGCRDLDSFISRWGLEDRPDSFLFVDSHPFGAGPRRGSARGR